MASTKLGLDISSIPGIDDVSSAIASLNDLVHFTDAAKSYFGVTRRRRRDVLAAVGLPQYTFAGLVVCTREFKAYAPPPPFFFPACCLTLHLAFAGNPGRRNTKERAG